jgi:hypothetical protein
MTMQQRLPARLALLCLMAASFTVVTFAVFRAAFSFALN